MTWSRTLVIVPACFGVLMLALADAPAQTKGVLVKPVIVAPLTDVDGKEMVVLSLTIDPGAASPIHTHPGDCVGMVTEGTVELLVEGMEPQRITAGDIVRNPRGTVHGFRNVGNAPARITNVLVVDKDKPRIIPQQSQAR